LPIPASQLLYSLLSVSHRAPECSLSEHQTDRPIPPTLLSCDLAEIIDACVASEQSALTSGLAASLRDIDRVT